METIVHLCKNDEWVNAQQAGEYRALSLETEEFIHCSRPEQILRVANQFYSGVTDLVLLWIDPQKLTAEIRWEPSDGDVFPHVYGSLNLDAVISVVEFPPGPDGVFRALPKPD